MIATSVKNLLDEYDRSEHDGLILTIRENYDKEAVRQYLGRFGLTHPTPDYCRFIKFVPRDRTALETFSREFFGGKLPSVSDVEPNYFEQDTSGVFCVDY